MNMVNMAKKIKVLVVDDSVVYREFLARGISADPRIEVVACAKDPYDARNKIIEHKPDVMTLDVEMPKMDGIEFLRKLMPQYPLPTIVIVQHMPPVFTKMYAQRLNNTVGLNVKEAETGDIVHQGCVLISPGDCHMRVEKAGSTYRVECFKDKKVNGHCPSVDVLFHSVTQAAGKDAIGVILTGMGYDGAKSLLSMRQKGARTVGQDEKSSIVYGMPKVAFDLGTVEKQASLDNIPQVICSFLNER